MIRPCDDYTPKSPAFQAGYAAFEADLERFECPVEFRDADQVDEWVAGWDQASEVDWERRHGEGQP